MPDLITIKTPQSEYLGRQAASADLLWIWDTERGELRQCKISDLPFGAGGGGGTGDPTVMLGSPFKLRLGDDQVTIDYDDVTKTYKTVISDLRLVGKDDYPISTTQLNNACFRDDQLVYDALLGKVTINNFNLQSNEVIILYPDGITATAPSDGGSYTELQDQITEIKRMLAPFVPTLTGAFGGMVLWGRPASEIPEGWQEVTAWRGRIPIGVDVTDEDINLIGKLFGAKTYTLATENLPDFTINGKGFQSISNNWRSGGAPSPGNDTGRETDREFSYNGGKAPFNIVPPVRTVLFIQYVGV